MVNQLNGEWKVKAEHLQPFYKQAVSLIQQFADLKIMWVLRKANAEADALASTPRGPLRPKPNLLSTNFPSDSGIRSTLSERLLQARRGRSDPALAAHAYQHLRLGRAMRRRRHSPRAPSERRPTRRGCRGLDCRTPRRRSSPPTP